MWQLRYGRLGVSRAKGSEVKHCIVVDWNGLYIGRIHNSGTG